MFIGSTNGPSVPLLNWQEEELQAQKKENEDLTKWTNCLQGRCSLNWQDYVMIAGIAITICFLVASIILGQYALTVGLSLALLLLCFGAYYIYTYSDYHNLKDRIEDLDLISEALAATNTALREQVTALTQQVESIRRENETHAAHNRALSSENDRLSDTNTALAAVKEGLEQQVADLKELAQRTVPELFATYQKLLSDIDGKQQIEIGLLVRSAQLEERIQAETRYLATIREQVAGQVELLKAVSAELSSHTAQFPILREQVAKLERLLATPLPQWEPAWPLTRSLVGTIA